MSRREGREGPSRRLHSSRFDRSPSPKKPKRDGKPATERTHGSHNRENVVVADRDQKQRRRLLDALPLEDPVAPETKEKSDIVDKEPIKKLDGLHEGSKNSSVPIEVPRSRYYNQHDDRRSARHGDRSFSRREHGRWSDGKEQPMDRNRERVEKKEERIQSRTSEDETWKRDKFPDQEGVAPPARKRPTFREHSRWSDGKEQPTDRNREWVEKKEERIQSRTSEDDTWKHDRFPDLEGEAPPARKRPAFRENKMLPAPGPTDDVKGSEASREPHDDRYVDTWRMEERDHYNGRSEKPERAYPRVEGRNPRGRGDMASDREMPRSNFPSRERDGNWSSGGRDRFSGRYVPRNNTVRRGGEPVEKWGHDLFEEANRSPNTKYEEEQIAKVEALLAL